MCESNWSIEAHYRSFLDTSSCRDFSLENSSEIRNHIKNHSYSSNYGKNRSSGWNSGRNSWNWKGCGEDTDRKIDKRNREDCSLHTIGDKISANYYRKNCYCLKKYWQHRNSVKDHRKGHLKDHHPSPYLSSLEDQVKASLGTKAGWNLKNSSSDYQGKSIH